MSNDKKFELLLDAARLMRSLADVLEAIAYTYKDVAAGEPGADVIEAEPVSALPEVKEVTLEEVRRICGSKSSIGLTAEVKKIIEKFGGTRLSDIDPSHYRELMEEVEALGNG